MKFNIQIKNFGKAKEANLKLAPFSVIAGTNSSGKSFVSRALYSFFSTINKDHITAAAMELIIDLKPLLYHALYEINNPSSAVINLHNVLINLTNELNDSIINAYRESTYLEQYSKGLILLQLFDKVDSAYQELLREIEGKKKYLNYKKRLSLVIRKIKELNSIVKEPSKILSDRIEKGFTEALKENFQVTNLSDLRSFNASADDVISFNFGNLGDIKINKESIGFSLTAESVHEFQSLYNVVFIESPIYWKLRKPLMRINDKNYKFLRAMHRDSEGLTGVPKYFYDLINLIDENIKSNSRTEDISSIQETISQIVGGELDISESGDIFFKDAASSRSVNINLTASGVTNLGLIGLLLKKNVIAKGSFIFVDEPEVNLHPAWQKVMIETLYKLSRNGINVVIASHSIDMMKYIENIMDDLSAELIEEHFAINRLSKDGVSCETDISPRKALANIKEDLAAPFYEMMLESGW